MSGVVDLDEVGEFGVPLGDEFVHLRLQLPLLLVLVGGVVLGKASLTLTILQQQEVNHRRDKRRKKGRRRSGSGRKGRGGEDEGSKGQVKERPSTVRIEQSERHRTHANRSS